MQRAFLRLISALALTWVCSLPAPSLAQTAAEDDSANTGMILHMQRMRAFHDVDTGTQSTPPVIGQQTSDADPSGMISTFQPGGDTQTAGSPFFQNLGTNGRTCFTCHQPQTGWTVSAQSVQDRFNASSGADPIFRLVDGATCPTDDVSSADKKLQAYSLLLSKGLIRIGLLIPATADADFTISVKNDPYGCNTNPATGFSSNSGIVSTYRRPLPSTNLGFLDPEDPTNVTGRQLQNDADALALAGAAELDRRPDSIFRARVAIQGLVKNPISGTEIDQIAR